jgi:hypothetical protein
MIRRKPWYATTVICMALLLAGCGAGGEFESGEGAGGNIGSGAGADPNAFHTAGTVHYSYTIFSAAALPVGAEAAVLRADVSQSCVLPGRVAAFSPVASGVVTTAGSVSLRFSDARSAEFVEIIYIDSDASGRLDWGDRIWGTNPQDPAGMCLPPTLESEQPVNWDGVAAVTGGSATYTGEAQDFLAWADRSQLPAATLIIGESGYGSL